MNKEKLMNLIKENSDFFWFLKEIGCENYKLFLASAPDLSYMDSFDPEYVKDQVLPDMAEDEYEKAVDENFLYDVLADVPFTEADYKEAEKLFEIFIVYTADDSIDWKEAKKLLENGDAIVHESPEDWVASIGEQACEELADFMEVSPDLLPEIAYKGFVDGITPVEIKEECFIVWRAD